jgi:hypothetical protein
MQVITTIDVAHPPRKPNYVENEIDETLSRVNNSTSLRIIKIIHGQSGTTKETVRNWAHNNRRRLKGVIYGEDYTILDKQTQKMRDEAGQFSDLDLEASNGGITILWVK